MTTTIALKILGVYLAIGVMLFLIRHWRRWVPVLHVVVMLVLVWPYFVVTGHLVDDDLPEGNDP